MSPLTKEQETARTLDQTWKSNETIKKAEETKYGWTISTDQGTGFFIAKKHIGPGIRPQAGDEVATYVHNGWNVRGIDLRGEPLFYKTDSELAVEHEEFKEKLRLDKIKTFKKERAGLDRKFSKLPPEFQRRISWFRAWNPDFRVEYEAYEMSACVDAVKIAETMESLGQVRMFQKSSYERQRKLVPDLYEGHSGNSFAAAVHLALLYLTDPLLVIAEHGAMTPLVGCEDYGCAHPRPKDVIEAVNKQGTDTET